MSDEKIRFTVVLKEKYSGPPMLAIYQFFSLAGAEQWVENARLTGEMLEDDVACIYDDSGVLTKTL